jgi:two-component system sensor histidine kinase SenX3
MRQRVREQLSEHERAAARALEQVNRTSGNLARILEVLDLVPVGIVVVDDAGREVARNQLGSSFVGDRPTDTLVCQALAEALAAVREGGPTTRTLELHGPPPRTVQIRATPLATGGLAAVVEDASERRHLDAIRRDFVANVNHELRTPVGALSLLAEALAEETDLETVHRLAGRIAAEAGRAGVLIDELIDLSRVEANQERTDERLIAASIVDAAVHRVLALSELRRVGVSVLVDDPDLAVVGSRAQLVSAVANLLDNAVKYSEPDSKVEVRVTGTGGHAEIIVTDRGIGIPARDLNRIFERFYRVDRARNRKTGGSGLGLSIVRHTAVNHGGEVSVQSREGEGSTFTLRLPKAS